MKEKIYAMIPARIGSQRLKMKNLALIDGKPLIYFSIQASKKTKLFNKVIINSDHIIFSKIANRYNVDFYLRPKSIGLSKTKSDEVVYDFIKKTPEADIVVWVNSIAPLVKSEDLYKIINYFKKKKLDSLITVEKKQVHATFKKKPVNFDFQGKFLKTQNIVPVNVFSYAVMMWRTNIFLREYKKNKSAFFCGKFSEYSLESKKSFIVKNIEDLRLIEHLVKFKKQKNFYKPKYDKLCKYI